jgi:hypothetical protein
MNFETMMLRSLFGACVLVCGLALASMVSIKPAPVQLATSTAATVTTTTAG